MSDNGFGVMEELQTRSHIHGNSESVRPSERSSPILNEVKKVAVRDKLEEDRKRMHCNAEDLDDILMN